MNLEQARTNMLKQQIRAWGVLDDDILKLVQTTPREEFVPKAYRKLAFADLNIPLGQGEVMLTPKEEAYLLQALTITRSDTVLEIGTGSGYLTALLAKLAKRVYSIEINADFSQQAKAKLESLQLQNVELMVGNASQGWEAQQPYDVIVVTGSLPFLPPSIQKQLKPEGRMFAIVGQAPVMEALLIKRMDEQSFNTTKLFETVVPALQQALQPEAFIF